MPSGLICIGILSRIIDYLSENSLTHSIYWLRLHSLNWLTDVLRSLFFLHYQVNFHFSFSVKIYLYYHKAETKLVLAVLCNGDPDSGLLTVIAQICDFRHVSSYRFGQINSFAWILYVRWETGITLSLKYLSVPTYHSLHVL